MLELNPITVASISVVTNQKETSELSDKELFLSAYSEYKAVSKKTRPAITGLLNKAVESSTPSINVQGALKRVFKIAYNYVDMSVICKFDNLEYSNIAGLVKLFKYVDKHMEDKSSELRGIIKEVYESDMSPHRYNNAISSKITELKEEYKLKEQEDEFVFIDLYNMVQNSISKMTNEQLSKLIELARRNLKEVA